MPATFEVVSVVLSSVLTTGGTVTIGYPGGRSRGDYEFGVDHRLVWNGVVLRAPSDIAVALNATTVVFTVNANVTIPSGATIWLQLDRAGSGKGAFEQMMDDLALTAQGGKLAMVAAPLVFLSLGSPLMMSATGVCASQTPGSMPTTSATALALTINGALAAGGKAYMDVPRNISVTSAANVSTQTYAFGGIDVFGNVQWEWITGPNVTTVYGKKAFARVDYAMVWGTGAAAAVTVGMGKVFGLPFPIPYVALVLKEMNDGAVLTTGTFAAADASTQSGTTGDTRGTYSPAATVNGTIGLQLIIAAAKVTQGPSPYAGTLNGTMP
jgi:hypothetical protein